MNEKWAGQFGEEGIGKGDRTGGGEWTRLTAATRNDSA